mmetsp:Transcript_10111/g.17797  ORF Transcript_10111/g.17797 Transcript_10111/m.17797 type:complete len:851 (+) Transcript_10111:114-2666(+)
MRVLCALAAAAGAVGLARGDDGAGMPRDMVIATDESFGAFFVNPFQNDDEILEDVAPPPVIASKGAVNPFWKTHKVIVPPGIDFVAFTLWSGTEDAIKPYLKQDIVVTAIPQNEDLKTELVVRIGDTFGVEVRFECVKDTETVVDISVTKEGFAPWKFGVRKSCLSKNAEELIISTTSGKIVYSHATVASAFRVHDLRSESFIASKSHQTDTFDFHTIQREYTVVGEPVVEAYAPTKELLSNIAERSPMLEEVVTKYARFGADNERGQFYDNEEVDEEGGNTLEDSDDNEESYDYDEEHDTGFEDYQPWKRPIPTKIEALPSEKLMLSSDVCDPDISGEVYRKGKKGKLKIAHRFDYGEKKLLGFAQAGQLGLHGGKQLFVDYNCLQDGLAVIVLRVTVKPIQGENEHEEKIKLSWLKVCSSRQVEDGLISLMGLNVNLGLYTKDDPSYFPVLNGLTTDPFTRDNLMMNAGSEELSSSFYIHLTDAVEDMREANDNRQRIRVRKVDVVAPTRNPRMNVTLSGHGVYGGLVSSDPMPIVVNYNCVRRGSSTIGLIIYVDIVKLEKDGTVVELEKAPITRVSFSWVKTCAVVPITELNANTVNPAIFTVTEEDDNDPPKHDVTPVIIEGVTQPAFKNARGANIFTVPGDQAVFAVELNKALRQIKAGGNNVGKSKMPKPHSGIRFGTPVLTSSNTAIVASLRDIDEMVELVNIGRIDFNTQEGQKAMKAKEDAKANFPHIGSEFQVEMEDPVFLVVDHECHAGGSSVITMTLPVYGNSEQFAQYQWVKECTWADAQFSGREAGGAVVFFVILSIIVTSSVFCILLRKHKMRIKFLESKDKNGFEKMDVVSSL